MRFNPDPLVILAVCGASGDACIRQGSASCFRVFSSVCCQDKTQTESGRQSRLFWQWCERSHEMRRIGPLRCVKEVGDIGVKFPSYHEGYQMSAVFGMSMKIRHHVTDNTVAVTTAT